MRHRRRLIWCLLLCVSKIVVCQTSVQSRVEAVLDSWSGRASSREAVLKITPDPTPALSRTATSNHESELRRLHAISLLATFKSGESEKALGQIASDHEPKFRCSAMQALAELNSNYAIPLLIRKLDDHAVCMQLSVTDPAREFDVYVSDEAVRLLELITGQSLDQEPPPGVHRATKPWKDWWAKREGKAKPGT